MEIYTGIDCVDIERISHSIKRESFIKRCFGQTEQKYIESKNFDPHTVAGMFAAKEAFSKVLGTGVRGFALREVQVAHDELGRPYLLLSGNAKNAARGMNLSLSITHTDLQATAVVVGHLNLMGRLFKRKRPGGQA